MNNIQETSNDEQKLSDALSLLLKFWIKPCIVSEGTIKAIDEDKLTCDVEYEGGSIYSNVPLETEINSKASVIGIPKVGTSCVMTFRDHTFQSRQLLKCHEYEKYYIKIGNATLDILDDKFTFNGGENHGLVKILALVSNIQTRETRINAIVSSLTSLASACTSAGGTPLTGTVLGGLITTAISSIITPIPATAQSDLENTNILH